MTQKGGKFQRFRPAVINYPTEAEKPQKRKILKN